MNDPVTYLELINFLDTLTLESYSNCTETYEAESIYWFSGTTCITHIEMKHEDDILEIEINGEDEKKRIFFSVPGIWQSNIVSHLENIRKNKEDEAFAEYIRYKLRK